MGRARTTVCLIGLMHAGCLGSIESRSVGETPTPSSPPASSPTPAPGEPVAVFTPDRQLPAPKEEPPTGSVALPREFQPDFATIALGAGRALPLSGGTLLVLRDGKRALVSDPDRDRVFVADLTAGTVLKEVVLSPGDEPGRAAEDGEGRLHVALRGGGALATLSAPDYVLTRRPVCPAPRGVAAAADGKKLVVACAGGELVALAAAGGEPLWTRRLERDLRDVVSAPSGDRFFVTTFRTARAIVVDDNGETTATVAPPVALNLTRRKNSGPEGPAATRFRPAVAWRTVAGPAGGVLMLHQRAFTGEVDANPDRPSSSGGYGGHSQCGGGGIVQTVVSQLGESGGGKPSVELGGVLLGIDLAVSRDGQTLALVSPADHRIRGRGSFVVTAPVRDATASTDSGCLSAISLGPLVAPGEPDPVWSEGDRGFANPHLLRGEAVAVGFDGADDVVVQLREPAELRVPKRGIRIPLSSEARAEVGQAIFHSNTGTGIACASCHPEGGDDGHTWRFRDLGPRRTQSLRGGVAETVPLHWEGDMRDVGAIAREVFTRRMGGPALGSGEGEALAAWIEKIPRVPTSRPPDAAAVARGQALFAEARVGCATCHAGPRLTNNQTVDVGTGRPLQVPSLVGLGDRAPYMHTGCAPTLAARFSADCGGGERHGRTAQLSQEEAADLTAYLESL